MKSIILTLVGLFVAATMLAGCDDKERVIERRETMPVQTQQVPFVVPD